MRQVAILGAAGCIGIHTAKELRRRGIRVTAVGRSENRLRQAIGEDEGVTFRTADLTQPEGARRACEGAESIVYSVGAPYPRFDLHPPMMRRTVDAAAAAGVKRLIVVSSVYSYGHPRAAFVTEDHPREPETRKGAFRKEQEDIALAAHAAGKLQVVVLHLPDFLGPYAENSFSTSIFQSALANKTANWLGDPTLQHEFIYVPDVAPVIADLLERDDVWGERYNLAGPGTIQGEDFIRRVYNAACRRCRYRSVGAGMLRFMGWWNPMMRELVEMQYLMEKPVILDDSKLRAKLGKIEKTYYANAITGTIAWLRGIPSLA
jgi:nucleoside-diphosphate-sugar epimerase